MRSLKRNVCAVRPIREEISSERKARMRNSKVLKNEGVVDISGIMHSFVISLTYAG